MKTQIISICLTGLLIINQYISGQGVPAENTLIPIATGLGKPVCITHAGDNRIFVLDQQGYIWIIDTLGNVKIQPFLDIHTKVVYGGEAGLLGLAFHPQFKTNGYFYVNYIDNAIYTQVSRFKVSSGNPDIADPASEFKILTVPQPYQNHNGGDIRFGPDGYLYIAFGDGGSGGDPENRAQNLMDFMGKILRINVDNGNPYSVPSDNPFYNSASALKEIWAFGLRNPWRISFDKLTGDLWMGDVGQDAVEEINFQPASSKGGENYGWRCYEGNNAYNKNNCAPDSTFTFPVYTYPHGYECSVTGGNVYRGSVSSPYYGHYFFADYCSDKIWTLRKNGNTWDVEIFGQFSGNNFSAFGEDVNGQLYIAGHTSGKIFRLFNNPTQLVSLKKKDIVLVSNNAGSNIFQIQVKQNLIFLKHLRVYDTKGVLITSKLLKSNHYSLQLDYLPAGVYILSVELNNNETYNYKIFVEPR